MVYIPPGSSVQGILQARVLEWVAISFTTIDGGKHYFNPGLFPVLCFSFWIACDQFLGISSEAASGERPIVSETTFRL